MQELNWTTADGLEIRARFWPAADARGSMCIVHGVGDHGGRFAHVAQFFTEHGISVLVPDHRGHGRSAGQRGYVPSFDVLLDDLDQYLITLKGIAPGPPLVYAQSMGATIAADFALRRDVSLSGMILSSPFFRLAFEPPRWKMLIGNTLGAIFPRMTLGTGIDVRQLTRDPAKADEFLKDRLRHQRITARLFFGALESGSRSMQNAAELSVPTLLMHGEKDTITSHRATERFAAECGNCDLMLWPDSLHELHNEINRREVLAAALKWIDGLLPSRI